jgi:hypothetical protein
MHVPFNQLVIRMTVGIDVVNARSPAVVPGQRAVQPIAGG